MSKGTILVVDDESYIREILERFLSKKGYNVITAEDGDQAVVYFKLKNPDLVLLDILMPGRGGVAAFLRILKINPKARVVMVTGVMDDEVGNFVLRKGVYDYITKPINLSYLENSVLTNVFLSEVKN